MAADYFGSKYFSGGYFPDSYFGTGEAADPNAMQCTIQGSSSCTATLSVAEPEDQRQPGGVSRKRRAPVVDIIWPEDPRHPNYIAPVQEPEPKTKQSPTVVRIPKVAARPAAEAQPEPAERPRYDVELALLLLAA